MPNSGFDGKVFPEAFCTGDVHCVRRDDGSYGCRAMPYRDHVAMRCEERAIRFVATYLPGERGQITKCFSVHADFMAQPTAVFRFTPFRSVPYKWCADRLQIECARDLRESSSRQSRKLLLEIFKIELHAQPEPTAGYAPDR